LIKIAATSFAPARLARMEEQAHICTSAECTAAALRVILSPAWLIETPDAFVFPAFAPFGLLQRSKIIGWMRCMSREIPKACSGYRQGVHQSSSVKTTCRNETSTLITASDTVLNLPFLRGPRDESTFRRDKRRNAFGAKVVELDEAVSM
jgi:hypothetical protein